ncbi:hypothetical protein A9P98_12285 [Cylindrospermopsis raciborskii CS-505]|uniref:Transposase IS200-like domain-containing protein n=1 Tax=Cylindrospermopsis raciborskii CS-505 TaxID=533240 RepID=A0A853MC50_9CYAN|nr:hypothetical protein A9P98_12285 [Cylindrospermopsis raciborskii CS-505]
MGETGNQSCLPRGSPSSRSSDQQGNAVVHLVWIAKRLRQIIYELAKEKDWYILALKVAPDHVHLFVEHQPDVAINQVTNSLSLIRLVLSWVIIGYRLKLTQIHPNIRLS